MYIIYEPHSHSEWIFYISMLCLIQSNVCMYACMSYFRENKKAANLATIQCGKSAHNATGWFTDIKIRKIIPNVHMNNLKAINVSYKQY